jgi:hypothetical protein
MLAIVGIVLALSMTWDLLPASDLACAACGKPISGDRVTAGGASYHPDHFVCALCGSAIKSRYVEDHWGNAYHRTHEGAAPKCDYCSRFLSPSLTGGGVTYDDGRVACGICRRSAIVRASQATALMKWTALGLKGLGIDVNTGGIRLHLVDLGWLRTRTGDGSHTLRGYTSYEETTLGGARASTSIDVYLLSGMPREDAVATLAHELMHVWHSLRHLRRQDPAFVEGSCNYASYLVLSRDPTPQAGYIIQKLMESDDLVYGGGFRRVKRFAEEKGVDAWLRRLAGGGRPPSGY